MPQAGSADTEAGLVPGQSPAGGVAGDAGNPGDARTGRSVLSQVPIEIVISVGRARPTVRELLRLSRDSVLALDRRVDEPVELYVGDRMIARGTLEELDGAQAGQMAVRLTEVVDLSDGL